MKNWDKRLLVNDLLLDAKTVSGETMLVIRDRILDIDPNVEFRETELKHYDAAMLTSPEDQLAFIEDLYDWADDNSVWVE